MFYDNPEVMYENPAPPSDYESEDEIEFPDWVIPDEYRYKYYHKMDPSQPYLEIHFYMEDDQEPIETTIKYGNVNAAENTESTADSKKEKHSKVGKIIEVKQERKQAEKFERKRRDDRCDICNIELNGPSHYSSHMTGKNHKKAEKLLEMQALKLSEPVVMEFETFPKKPGRERIQVYNEESEMQSACDAFGYHILGLDNVAEINGYEEVKYFCDLCCATCSAATLISHLTGHRHLKSCLKKYYPNIYFALKDRKDRNAAREVKVKLLEAQRTFGRGKIRVFRDVRKKRPTDAQFLMKDFGSFFCSLCMASMENHSLWEEHVREESHMMNKKRENSSLKARPEPFDPSKPSTGRQGQLEQTERFLQLCVSSMENLSTCEENVSGKKHMKNKKRKESALEARPEPFEPSKPSTGRQGQLEQAERFLQTFEREYDPKATDAQFLRNDFGYLFCKLCKASMESLSTWEEHVSGKKHMKNKKREESAFEESHQKK